MRRLFMNYKMLSIFVFFFACSRSFETCAMEKSRENREITFSYELPGDATFKTSRKEAPAEAYQKPKPERDAWLMVDALDKGDLEALEMLVGEGANVNAALTKTVWGVVSPLMYIPALHLCERFGQEKILKMVHSLLNRGADITLVSDLGHDMLDIIAHSTGNSKLIHTILELVPNTTLARMSRDLESIPDKTIWQSNKLRFIKNMLKRDMEIAFLRADFATLEKLLVAGANGNDMLAQAALSLKSIGREKTVHIIYFLMGHGADIASLHSPIGLNECSLYDGRLGYKLDIIDIILSMRDEEVVQKIIERTLSAALKIMLQRLLLDSDRSAAKRHKFVLIKNELAAREQKEQNTLKVIIAEAFHRGDLQTLENLINEGVHAHEMMSEAALLNQSIGKDKTLEIMGFLIAEGASIAAQNSYGHDILDVIHLTTDDKYLMAKVVEKSSSATLLAMQGALEKDESRDQWKDSKLACIKNALKTIGREKGTIKALSASSKAFEPGKTSKAFIPITFGKKKEKSVKGKEMQAAADFRWEAREEVVEVAEKEAEEAAPAEEAFEEEGFEEEELKSAPSGIYCADLKFKHFAWAFSHMDELHQASLEEIRQAYYEKLQKLKNIVSMTSRMNESERRRFIVQQLRAPYREYLEGMFVDTRIDRAAVILNPILDTVFSMLYNEECKLKKTEYVFNFIVAYSVVSMTSALQENTKNKEIKYAFDLPDGKKFETSVAISGIYYQLLGVGSEATLEEITQAYTAKIEALKNASIILNGTPEICFEFDKYLFGKTADPFPYATFLAIVVPARNEQKMLEAEFELEQTFNEIFKVLSNEASRKQYDAKQLEIATAKARGRYWDAVKKLPTTAHAYWMQEFLDKGDLANIEKMLSEGTFVDTILTKTGYGLVTPLLYIGAMNIKKQIGGERALQMIELLINKGANVAYVNDLDNDVIDIIAHTTSDEDLIKKILEKTPLATLEQMQSRLEKIPETERTLWIVNKCNYLKKALDAKREGLKKTEQVQVKTDVALIPTTHSFKLRQQAQEKPAPLSVDEARKKEKKEVKGLSASAASFIPPGAKKNIKK